MATQTPPLRLPRRHPDREPAAPPVDTTRRTTGDRGRVVRVARALRSRPELVALLVLAGALNLWNLGINGQANDYYSAAVRSMAGDWHAFLYGSFDAAGVQTVDKPPLALWVQALSVRVFGFSSWSVLVPQALMGVATVGLTYDLARRVFGRVAGGVAGLALVLTPIAVAISRHNNPDALLILCSVAALWFLVRGLEDGRTRWLALSGLMIGLGFETKMAAALTIVPGIVVAWLWIAPQGRPKAVGQLGVLGAVAAVVGLAWPVLMWLTPSADRPYISGTNDNSIWSLIFGYNGLGRLFGQDGGPATTATGNAGGMGGGGGGMGGVFGGDAGPFRLLNASLGGQAGWLVGTALVAGLGLLLLTRLRRADARTGFLLAVGGAFLVTAVAFSRAAGIFHPYYVSLLAPFVAALAGAGIGTVATQGRDGARHRSAPAEASVSAVRHTTDNDDGTTADAAGSATGPQALPTSSTTSTLATADTRTPTTTNTQHTAGGVGGAATHEPSIASRSIPSTFDPIVLRALGPALIAAGVAAELVVIHNGAADMRWITPVLVVGGILASLTLAVGRGGARGRTAVLAAIVALLLTAPGAWAVQTLGHATSSTFPAGGPAAGGMGAGGPGGGGGGRGPGGMRGPAGSAGGTAQGTPPSDPGGAGAGGSATPGAAGATGSVTPGPGGRTGGGGGMFGGTSTELTASVAYAAAHGGGTVAVSSQSSAAASILSGTDPANVTVAGIGGFSGSESAVSADWLAEQVEDGTIRWVLTTATGQGPGGGGASGGRVGATEIMALVQRVGKEVPSVDGLYDLQGLAAAIRAAG